MVGPVSDGDRRRVSRQLGIAFVALVGLSSGLTAFYGGAAAVEVGLVGAVGIGVGVLLLFVLLR